LHVCFYFQPTTGKAPSKLEMTCGHRRAVRKLTWLVPATWMWIYLRWVTSRCSFGETTMRLAILVLFGDYLHACVGRQQKTGTATQGIGLA
jgi:hypothetical protein